MVYVQAKRWHGPVGVDTVMTFVGGLEAKRAMKGVMSPYFALARQHGDLVSLPDVPGSRILAC